MSNSCFYESPIGVLCISEQNGKITGLCLQQGEADNPPSGLLREACLQLDEYFQGRRKQFDLPLHYEGTAFQRRVWSQLQKIPYGETRSYEEVAAAIGSPKAQRAVGQANRRNPIMIIVPCHRVLRKNGDIGGFACGLSAKRYLLELERIRQQSF